MARKFIFWPDGGGPGQGGGGGVGPDPWFEENWDYDDTADLLADPNGWFTRTGTTNITLATGLTTPWGGTKAMQNQFTPSAASGGLDIIFPDAATDQPREIWQEVYLKWSTDWKTDWDGTGNPDHKTILWFGNDESGSTRWSYKLGVFASANTQVYLADYFPSWSNTPDLINDVWPSGDWYRVRVHFKMNTEGNADGIIEAWFDDAQIADDSSLEGGSILDSHYFYKNALSRNMNQPPDMNVEILYGRVRVYTTDPGW